VTTLVTNIIITVMVTNTGTAFLVTCVTEGSNVYSLILSRETLRIALSCRYVLYCNMKHVLKSWRSRKQQGIYFAVRIRWPV